MGAWLAPGVKRARRRECRGSLLMAISVVNITPAQLQGFSADLLRRVASHAGAFLRTQDGKAPSEADLRVWTDEAVAAGFEITEDIARYLVLKARCDAKLFREVMIEADAEPVLRLIHMESEHPDLWGVMVEDIG